jgi:glycosyltransferase involved in cell wall biosynthesis
MAMVKILVAIPALNEEKTIAEVIVNVKKEIPNADILVINDGSTDKTGQIAKKFDISVLEFSTNMGVGAAMRLAFKYALRNDYTHLMQIDADGQHPATQAVKLLEHLNDYEILIGSRFAERSNYQVSRLRKIAMRILASAINYRLKSKLTDVTSGLRLYYLSAIKFFSENYPQEYLGDTVESLIQAGNRNFRIGEIPIKMKIRQGGIPSQNNFRSLLYLIRAIVLIILSILQNIKRQENK